MKRTLFAAIVSLFILSGCRKNNTVPIQTDSWKLIEVYDKGTATTSFPPAGTTTDVVITFLPGNKFSGHTLKNTFTDGTYVENGNDITFGTFSMTKINEDAWGGSFLAVLSACYLQSFQPCVPSKITRQGNIIKIASPMRYDITLQKL